MATQAIPVFGGEVGWATSQGGPFTKIPECKTILVPETTQDYIEVTSLDSDSGYREYINGLKDAGEITLELNYTRGVYQTAEGYSSAGTLVYFETTLVPLDGETTGDKFVFGGRVTPAIPAGQNGEEVKLQLKVRLSGAPQFTAGS